jgi:hypothetical protein
MERLYNVTRWTVFPRGGHFAAVEEPQVVAEDLAAFFREIGTGLELQGGGSPTPAPL